jgi:hypothetical protein
MRQAVGLRRKNPAGVRREKQNGMAKKPGGVTCVLRQTYMFIASTVLAKAMGHPAGV